MGATKCTNVIRQGVGLYYAKELTEILRHKRFSIIPDETTDVSSEQLGVCVMYVDEKDLTPNTLRLLFVATLKFCDLGNCVFRKCFNFANTTDF